jgi:hypothetical protein
MNEAAKKKLAEMAEKFLNTLDHTEYPVFSGAESVAYLAGASAAWTLAVQAERERIRSELIDRALRDETSAFGLPELEGLLNPTESADE